MCISCLLPSTANAEHMLQILPPRVVLDSSKSANLTLVNRGDSAGNYRIFFRNIRTNEVGKFQTIEEAAEGELFSDKLVRFSPRRITVDGQNKQDVRVVVRKPRDLADGEYRSHLVFRSLPKQPTLEDEDAPKKLAMTFNPTLEVTIPVIVRHGKLNASINFSDFKLSRDKDSSQQLITFHIKRGGNRSIYGDINIWWQTSDGKELRVAAAKGVSVYYPNPLRIFTLALESQTIIDKGKLRIQYIEDPAYGGNLSKESIFPI